ncbi:MAG: LuxR C-terminal-related transcriptional regulator [Nocardioides sp.]
MAAPLNLPIEMACAAPSLTQRECEVMSGIAAGYSNAEIAQHLYLSSNSVKTYIRGAYSKAGVTTRAQAVLWGVRHGFVDLDELLAVDQRISSAATGHPRSAA